jgi:hypothetical protein
VGEGDAVGLPEPGANVVDDSGMDLVGPGRPNIELGVLCGQRRHTEAGNRHCAAGKGRARGERSGPLEEIAPVHE